MASAASVKDRIRTFGVIRMLVPRTSARCLTKATLIGEVGLFVLFCYTVLPFELFQRTLGRVWRDSQRRIYDRTKLFCSRSYRSAARLRGKKYFTIGLHQVGLVTVWTVQ